MYSDETRNVNEIIFCPWSNWNAVNAISEIGKQQNFVSTGWMLWWLSPIYPVEIKNENVKWKTFNLFTCCFERDKKIVDFNE